MIWCKVTEVLDEDHEDILKPMMVHRSLGMRKIILEVTMYQRWDLRRHTIRRLNTFVDELPQFRKNITKI